MSYDAYVRLAAQIAGWGMPVAEHRFHPTRRWRFDYAWVQHKLALEIEGGIWVGGRHNRATGFVKDVEKYNEAAVLGWRVLRLTPAQVQQVEPLVALLRRVVV